MGSRADSGLSVGTTELRPNELAVTVHTCQKELFHGPIQGFTEIFGLALRKVSVMRVSRVHGGVTAALVI